MSNLYLGSSKKIIISRKDAKTQSFKLFLASLRLCVRNFWDNLNFGIALNLKQLLLAVLMLTYFLYFGTYATQRYLAFETGAFDVGVYVQPIWNFVNGRDFAVSLLKSDGALRWANHVEPILFLIAPLYKLWPDPRTLLWLQVAALTLAAWPMYALAVQRLQNEWSSLVIVLAYFLMPATEAVTLFDFHAVTLAPLFLLTAFYFLGIWKQESKSTLLLTPYSLLLIFLALSTKEDISLHVFMIGLYLILFRRRWRDGLILAIIGLVWFYIAFQVIIPAYRVSGRPSIFVGWFETLGHTPLDIALSPFTKPDKVLTLLFRPGSLSALAMLTTPMALLPLVGFPYLIMATPSLAFSLLGDNPTLRQLETWHYATPMLPFVMLATIDGLAKLNHFWNRKASLAIPVSYLPTLILLIVSLTYHYWRGYSPLSRLTEWPQVGAHQQLGQQLAAQIPPQARVLAQAQLIPQIAHHEELAIWDGPLSIEYDYIWLDVSHPKMPNRFNAHGDLLTGLAIEPQFGFVATVDGYMVLKKGAKRVPLREEFFTFTQYEQIPPTAKPFQAVFSDTFKLVAVKSEVRRLATSETEPQVVLFFEVLQRPTADNYLFIYLLNENGKVVGATDFPQPALFWWPTSHWRAGDKRQVRVNTVPWWTGDQATFSYALGFAHRNDAWDVAARLPVVSEQELLNDQTLLPIATFRRFAGIAYPQ